MATYRAVKTVTWPTSPRFYLVGDSLTAGHLQGQGGWRKFAYQALVQAGYNPDFRGSIVNTTDSPPLASTSIAGHSHSGLDGASGHNWYASYWDSSNFSTSFPTAADYPQIICIAVGTNDADTGAAATDFCRLMDKAATAVPSARILMATAPHTESSATNLDTQAAQVRIEVAARRAAGANVRLVDVHAIRLVNGDWQDGLHLSTRGYQKVAELAWIPAMLATLEGAR